MFCKKCAQKIDDDSKYCKYCGVNQLKSRRCNTPAEQKSKNMAILMLVLGMIMFQGGFTLKIIPFALLGMGLFVWAVYLIKR